MAATDLNETCATCGEVFNSANGYLTGDGNICQKCHQDADQEELNDRGGIDSGVWDESKSPISEKNFKLIFPLTWVIFIFSAYPIAIIIEATQGGFIGSEFLEPLSDAACAMVCLFLMICAKRAGQKHKGNSALGSALWMFLWFLIDSVFAFASIGS